MRAFVAAVVAALTCFGSVTVAQAQLFPRDVTRIHVPLFSDAPDEAERTFHTVALHEHIAELRLVPRAAAQIANEVAVRGATLGDAPIRIESGAKLVAAFDDQGGRYFCALRRRPGLFPLQMWACLQDADDDGVFERAGQANPAMGVVLPMPYSVFTMYPVNVAYTELTGVDMPAYEVAIAYQYRRNTIGFALRAREAGDAEWRDFSSSNSYLSPFTATAATALPATLTLLGAQFEVQSFDPNTRSIVARVSQGLPEAGFEIDVAQVPAR